MNASAHDGDGARDDPDFVLDPTVAAIATPPKLAIAYWQQKRGARFAPSRADIEPREARAFLSHIQIFDILDEGRAFRPRLIGTAMIQVLNEDSTGRIFDGSSTRLVVHRVLRAIRWVVEHRAPLRTFAARTAIEGKDIYAHETVFLPLSNDGAAVDMMLVVGALTPAA